LKANEADGEGVRKAPEQKKAKAANPNSKKNQPQNRRNDAKNSLNVSRLFRVFRG